MKKRALFCGNYVCGAGPDTDHAELSSDAKDAGVKGFVRHLNTPWMGRKDGSPFYFWPFDGIKFDLKSGKVNQYYVDQLESMIMEATKKGLMLSVCFMDMYSDQKANYPWIDNKHPFRQNNIRESLEDKDHLRALYNNRLGAQGWYWLDTRDEKHPETFHPSSQLGEAIENFVVTVVDKFKMAKEKYPNRWPGVIWRSFNEERGLVNPNPPPHHLNNYGDETFIDFWIEERWKAAGFVKNEDYLMTNDWMPYSHLSTGAASDAPFRKNEYVPDWKDWFGANKYLNSIGALHEIHSVEDVAVWRAYLSHAGGRTNLLASSDGGRENDPNWYKDQHKLVQLWRQAGALKWLDVKFAGPHWNWSPLDVMKNWRRYFPEWVENML